MVGNESALFYLWNKSCVSGPTTVFRSMKASLIIYPRVDLWFSYVYLRLLTDSCAPQGCILGWSDRWQEHNLFNTSLLPTVVGILCQLFRSSSNSPAGRPASGLFCPQKEPPCSGNSCSRRCWPSLSCSLVPCRCGSLFPRLRSSPSSLWPFLRAC